jgi:hypothetical protein
MKVLLLGGFVQSTAFRHGSTARPGSRSKTHLPAPDILTLHREPIHAERSLTTIHCTQRGQAE